MRCCSNSTQVLIALIQNKWMDGLHFVTNSFPVKAVQKLLQSVKTCQSYWQKFTATFLWTAVQLVYIVYSVNYKLRNGKRLQEAVQGGVVQGLAQFPPWPMTTSLYQWISQYSLSHWSLSWHSAPSGRFTSHLQLVTSYQLNFISTQISTKTAPNVSLKTS